MYPWLCVTLLALVHCGPACPSAGARRDDLLPDRTAGERRIVLDENVIAQVNVRPAVLRLRLAGTESATRRFSIHLPSGVKVAQSDVVPGPDGRYRITLAQPGGDILKAGVYRLRVEVPDMLEVSFEVRSCTVYY
jgi:hypothetical protein